MIAGVEIEPVEDETLISQLVRLAEANGFRSVAEVHRRIGAELPHLDDLLHGPSDSWLEVAADHTGIDTERLFSGTRLGGRHRSVRRWRPRIEARIGLYCPECISNDGAWRLAWLVPYAEVCPVHELLLIDHREHCANPSEIKLRWCLTESTRRLCHRKTCAMPLSAFAADPATPDALVRHQRFLEIEAEFRLRVLGDEHVELPGGRFAPRVLDTRSTRQRTRRDPPARIELLDRPDWGLVHRVGQR